MGGIPPNALSNLKAKLKAAFRKKDKKPKEADSTAAPKTDAAKTDAPVAAAATTPAAPAEAEAGALVPTHLAGEVLDAEAAAREAYFKENPAAAAAAAAEAANAPEFPAALCHTTPHDDTVLATETKPAVPSKE